jgi:hypothetical protein
MRKTYGRDSVRSRVAGYLLRCSCGAKWYSHGVRHACGGTQPPRVRGPYVVIAAVPQPSFDRIAGQLGVAAIRGRRGKPRVTWRRPG